MNNKKNCIRTAVFLDRDGTIIEEKGYLSNPADISYFPNTVSALRLLQKDHLLFLISNQSGVGEGFISKLDVERINEYIIKFFSSEGIFIKEVYYCPHRKIDNCICRKPKTYFIEKAIRVYKIDIKKSFVIGDHPSDIELAKRSGATGIFVLTGHGRKHIDEVPPATKIVEEIGEAAKYIHNISNIVNRKKKQI